MSKNYQKAASGWLYALAAVIAGTCFSATPAQSATCFLPSGECSTGKIGAGPSGGESTPEYCVGYDITEKEYNAKYNNACWDCSDSCVKTSGGTFYKCKTVNNTTWYDKYNVCCTDGTKYDKDDGKCCAGGKCDHPCSGGKQWSPTLKQCVCPSNLETDGNGNCCASGQVLDENKNCTTPCTMNDCGSYPYTTDPGNSEACDLGCNKGTRYKCKSGYTYSGGKCVEQCAASGYTLTSAKDSHCYSCSTCPTDSSKYKCTESVKSGYQLVGNSCVNKCSDYTLTSKKDENCYSCTPCPYDSSKYKCTENVKSNYQLVNGVCSRKPTENCSKYSVAPWVVNGADNSVKCRAINSSYVPCGEKATCGGTQYVECKNSSQCGNGGGSTGNSCTASTYTASVTCSQSYSTDECCSAFGCSGKGCGTGYFNCVFDVPSCAFSSVSIHVTDNTGQDRIVASAGAGKTTRVLNNYQIPGPHTPCEFFASSSSLGKVKGEAVSGQSYTWKCSYTKKKQ